MKRMLIIALTLLAGCTTQIKMQTEWTNPKAAKGTLSSTLVIVVAKDKLARQVFENAFAYQMKERGVQAVASHKELPQFEKLDRASVEEVVRRLGLKTVLITRLVDFEQKEESVILGYGAALDINDWYDHYSTCYVYISGPTTIMYTDKRTTILETKVFDVADAGLLWNGRARVRYAGANAQALKPYVTYMANRIKGSGLIP
jgi:hypothetical protein